MKKLISVVLIIIGICIFFYINVAYKNCYINLNYIAEDDKGFGLISQHIKDIIIDLRYASSNNITGKVIYENNSAYLRMGTINKLKKEQDKLKKYGYRLVIWDAYRPAEAQFKLWEIMPDGNYIANPYKGYSSHTKGNCIDVTLATLDGEYLKMPTEFDDFTEKADRNYDDINDKEALKNVKILEEVMTQARVYRIW